MTDQSISKKILFWQSKHGRKNLPWQKEVSLYSVWISEIMLQQTQVSTVIAYYNRFMSHFPTIKHLANSTIDEVLRLWSGLGYYRRARYLHQSAIKIEQDYKGVMPDNIEQMLTLPGIGRSTAGAILSIVLNKRFAILDGNVKRVISRCFAIEGTPNSTKINQQLWEIAENILPYKRCGDYNQAIMDIGAMICKSKSPLCHSCPLQDDCIAFQTNRCHLIPSKKKKQYKPFKNTIMAMFCNQNNQVLLKKRSNSGVWGGLWSLPEFIDLESVMLYVNSKFRCKISHQNQLEKWHPFKHSFTHYHLLITPIKIDISSNSTLQIQSENDLGFFSINSFEHNIATPVPVTNLLYKLRKSLK